MRQTFLLYKNHWAHFSADSQYTYETKSKSVKWHCRKSITTNMALLLCVHFLQECNGYIYSSKFSIFKSTPIPRSRFIYCKSLGCRISPFTQLTASNNPTSSPRRYMSFLTWVGSICWHSIVGAKDRDKLILNGVISMNSGNKRVWHCIGLDYNARRYICIAIDVDGWRLKGVALYRGIPSEIT
jgi:hypothetical protein